MKRYNITMADDLCDKLDNFIKDNHTNRSNVISVAVSQYINAMEALPTLQSQLLDLSKQLETLKP